MVFLLISGNAFEMEKAYQEGTAVADFLRQEPPQEFPSLVSKYQGTQIPEATFQAHAFSHKAQEAMVNPEGQLLIQTQKEGGSFPINPQKDPLFLEENRIVQDPEKVLTASKTEKKTPARLAKQTILCEEAGEAPLFTGHRILVVEVRKRRQKYAYAQVSGVQFKRIGKDKNAASGLTRGPAWVGHDQYYNYIDYGEFAPCSINYFDGCNNYPHTVTPLRLRKVFSRGGAPSHFTK